MRTFIGAASATLLMLAVTAGLNGTAANASGDEWGINGTYLATSNGEWAKTNEVFHDEASVRSTWTITTTCINKSDCTGEVTSDQGWTAEISTHNVEWVVKRDVENWEPCADGTKVTGQQIYRFYPADPAGITDLASTTYVGLDTTTGPSGACGRNHWLVISMPFKLIELT
jgi:hypothetical protein